MVGRRYPLRVSVVIESKSPSCPQSALGGFPVWWVCTLFFATLAFYSLCLCPSHGALVASTSTHQADKALGSPPRITLLHPPPLSSLPGAQFLVCRPPAHENAGSFPAM